jgi:hypothetical protein
MHNREQLVNLDIGIERRFGTWPHVNHTHNGQGMLYDLTLFWITRYFAHKVIFIDRYGTSHVFLFVWFFFFDNFFLARLAVALVGFFTPLVVFLTFLVFFLGERFEARVALRFTIVLVSSADDSASSAALAVSVATLLSRICLAVSLTSLTVSLAAVVAAFIESASSITAPLSLNALNASSVDAAFPRIVFATFLTALAVWSAFFR